MSIVHSFLKQKMPLDIPISRMQGKLVQFFEQQYYCLIDYYGTLYRVNFRPMTGLDPSKMALRH